MKMDQKDFLQLDKLSFTYPDSLIPALSEVSFVLPTGSIGLLCGKSGCGKTTLLKHLKRNQAPFGERTGDIRIGGKSLDDWTDRECAEKIGFVGQIPDEQIVTDTVWHELAFGLENMGQKTDLIRRRTAEIAEYFGISHWFRKKVAELSGGQKQILNLAAVMVMQPDLLLLDEPVSQLDPIAAGRFWQTLKQVNRDFGTMVLLSEQQLDQVLDMTDLVIVMEDGKIVGTGVPEELPDIMQRIQKQTGNPSPILDALPAPLRVYMEYRCLTKEKRERVERYLIRKDVKTGLSQKEDKEEVERYLIWKDVDAGPDQKNSRKESIKDVPISIREGRIWLHRLMEENRGVSGSCNHEKEERIAVSERENSKKTEICLEAKDLQFGYAQNLVLENFSLTLRKGEISCILGGNGSGKTTALKLLAGVYRPRRGRIRQNGQVFYLAQNPQSIFTEVTAWEELAEAFEGFGSKREAGNERHRYREMVNDLGGGQKKKNTVRKGDGEKSMLTASKSRTGRQDIESMKKEVDEMLAWLELEEVRERNPMDLSGGQQQRLALGKLLLLHPDVLLLDEPTKGMDAAFKQKLSRQLGELAEKGMSILIASHDLEFCARNASRCGLLFDGQIISSGETRRFFGESRFYTTSARRMTEGILPGCILWEDVVEGL